MTGLLELACSESYTDRILAGYCAQELIKPGRSLVRRVETIQFVASNINERNTSVDVSLKLAQQRCSEVGVDLDCCVASLLPKSLMYDFDFRNQQGHPTRAVSRDADSRLAMSFLVSLAISREDGMPGLAVPGPEIWKLIYEHVFRFPSDDRLARSIAFAESLGTHLSGDDAEWWAAAIKSKPWRTWLLLLGDLFLLATVRSSTSDTEAIYKFRRKSGRDPVRNHRVREQLGEPRTTPYRAFAVRLYDLGHARSEHVHIVAPPGTFLSGGYAAARPDLDEDVIYRRRGSRHEIVLYSKDAAMGNVLVLGGLWPETRGFISPMLFVCWYSTALLALALIAQATDAASSLTPFTSVIFAAMFFAPSIALGYLYKPAQDHEIRWRLGSAARIFGVFAIVLSFLAAGMTVVPAAGDGRWVVVAATALLTLIAVRFSMGVTRFTRRIYQADWSMKQHELADPRGKRLILSRASGPADSTPHP